MNYRGNAYVTDIEFESTIEFHSMWKLQICRYCRCWCCCCCCCFFSACFFNKILGSSRWMCKRKHFLCQIMLFISADAVIPCRMHRTTRAFELFSVCAFYSRWTHSRYDVFISFYSVYFYNLRLHEFAWLWKKIQCKSINFFVVWKKCYQQLDTNPPQNHSAELILD